MIGWVRLVNPDRGQAPAATSGRLLATSGDGGRSWEVRVVVAGREFFTRRPLSVGELRSIPLSGGSAPGVPEPWHWHWCARGPAGEIRLTPAERPSPAELAGLGREIARWAGPDDALPRLDRFEVWLCDREGHPLALAATAISLELALAIPHLHPWQIAPGPRQTDSTWDFQRRINEQLNTCPLPGLYRFRARIYERPQRGDAVILHGPNGTRRRLPTSSLPEGLLAEPWESERLRLLRTPSTAPIALATSYPTLDTVASSPPPAPTPTPLVAPTLA